MLDVDGQSYFGGERRRRVSRVATLDGAAVLNDFGYSDADRALTLAWQPKDEAQEDTVRRITEIYSTVVLCMSDGAYEAAIESFEPQPETSTLRLLVMRRLSA
jgi:hypothetical protein